MLAQPRRLFSLMNDVINVRLAVDMSEETPGIAAQPRPRKKRTRKERERDRERGREREKKTKSVDLKSLFQHSYCEEALGVEV